MPADDLRPVSSFDQLVEVLGGPSLAAQLLGRTPQQVCQWKVRHGTFPAELYPKTQTVLAKLGYRAKLHLFRFEGVSRRVG